MTATRTIQEVAADPQPGDIYEGSWGYDQTNAEFWEVIKRTPATVTLRQLAVYVLDGRVLPHQTDFVGRFHTEATGWMRDFDGNDLYDRTPVFVEKVCRLGRKTYNSDAPGVSLKMKSYYSVHPWDGQAAYDTIAAGQPGH